MKNKLSVSENRLIFFEAPDRAPSQSGPEEIENERDFKYDISMDAKTKAAMLKAGYEIEDEDTIRLGTNRIHFNEKTERVTFELGRNNEIICRVKDKGEIIEQMENLPIRPVNTSASLGILLRVTGDPHGYFRNLKVNEQLWQMLIEADLNHGITLAADSKSGTLTMIKFEKGRRKAIDTFNVFTGISTMENPTWQKSFVDSLQKIMGDTERVQKPERVEKSRSITDIDGLIEGNPRSWINELEISNKTYKKLVKAKANGIRLKDDYSKSNGIDVYRNGQLVSGVTVFLNDNWEEDLLEVIK
tara:strand:- start:675 stop:1580 length:906 start_codon:yes stop_codon:yes gene_type:complete